MSFAFMTFLLEFEKHFAEQSPTCYFSLSSFFPEFPDRLRRGPERKRNHLFAHIPLPPFTSYSRFVLQCDFLRSEIVRKLGHLGDYGSRWGKKQVL